MPKLILILTCLFFVLGSNAQQWDRKIPYSLKKKIFSDNVDSIIVSVSSNDILQLVKLKKLNVLKHISPGIVIARIKISDVPAVSSISHVYFINEVLQAKEELTTGAFDLSLNKINLVHSVFPFINGESFRASIKERLFDTLDIDLKNRVFYTGFEPSVQTPHASLMATMIAGGANSSPFAKGVAWRSGVSSSGFQNLFADADSIFTKNSISVQNHSYGTIVENFYGNEALSYDQQCNNLPYLVHVFSAGNSGMETGTGAYIGISQFANLTGNFKHAKNVLTVGSVDSAGQIMPLSSKGPAYDGRIRPELMAYGEDGSSGAAATVSGVVLLLQDAYKRIHNDLPSSSLVRAILLNSADDIGNPYPDYNSGFGNLNAYNALNAINETRYHEDELTQGEIKTFSIAVPAAVSQLKVTIAWNDPASIPNAHRSLVNDLDLQLSSNATAEVWLPWVLDHSASAGSLKEVAQRKKDTLNNAEQITIENPSPGQYTIEVRGTNLTTSVQSYSVSWQLDTVDMLYWTFPSQNDKLIAGNTHWLRWETNRQGPVQIEYATNGNNWKVAGVVSDVNLQYLKWKLPDTVTTAVLRLVHATGNILSDSFTISPQPVLEVGYNCADSFLLYWNRIANLPFEVYQLGDLYLEPFTQVNDTAIILKKTVHPAIYYSIAPLINGKRGIRSNTLNYPAQGPACYINAFYLQSQTSTAATFTADMGTLFGITSVTLEKLTSSGFKGLQTFTNLTTNSFSITDTTLSQGENHYRLKIVLSGGSIIYSNIEIVYYWPVYPVVLYPNPLMQNETLKIIANESGRYTLKIYDSQGRLLFDQLLVSTQTNIIPGFLSKGLYVISVYDRDHNSFTQKIIVQ